MYKCPASRGGSLRQHGHLVAGLTIMTDRRTRYSVCNSWHHRVYLLLNVDQEILYDSKVVFQYV